MSATQASASASCCLQDPFSQQAQEPWEQLDLDSSNTAAHGAMPPPEIMPDMASVRSIVNEDDTVISSGDPAACEFLLAALAFQEQQQAQTEDDEHPQDYPVVTVAVTQQPAATEDKAKGSSTVKTPSDSKACLSAQTTA